MSFPSSRPSITAVILAGGRGLRLGGAVKAGVSVGGVPLLTRVSDALAGIDGPLIVARGDIALDLMPIEPRHIPIVDRPDWGGGPLAGIASATYWFHADHLLSVAVDTPFFPPDFAALAREVIGDADAVIARYAAQPYFTNALWAYGAMQRLQAADPGAMSAIGIKGFAANLKVRWLDWPEGPEGNPFDNVNTPADLAEAERRAAEFGVGKLGQNR